MKRVFVLSWLLLAAILVLAGVLAVRTNALTPTLTARVDWAVALQSPPAAGSPEDQADMATLVDIQTKASPSRKALALADNDFDVFNAYKSVLSQNFSAQDQPALKKLLDYAGIQLNRASSRAKNAFARPRPYVTKSDLTLCPTQPPSNSSYPSGHAAWGRLSARILAGVYPAQASMILQRGHDYGQSRIICGFHYPTDVVAGRMMGEVLFEKLTLDAEFQRLFAAAKAEVRT